MRFLRIMLPLAMCVAGAIGSARAAVLYVADAGADAVFGYRLARGIPSTAPATTLLLAYAPRQLAPAADGALYVEGKARRRIDVYAPGASGHALPKRTIDLPYAPSAIATDVEGYLYVGAPGGTVDAYAPNARNHAKPVGHVALGFSSAGIGSLALDAAGRIFIGVASAGGDFVEEYANPRGSPVFIRALATFIGPPLEMAVDATDELYGTDVLAHVYAFEPTSCCIYPYDRQLAVQAKNYHPVGIALDGRHAFVISAQQGLVPAIYTLDMLRGMQRPLSVVTGANLQSPAYVVVGE
jgi:hypothetical protein